MRKHSSRKWLHAVLDLLPLIIIPIFAIYSHRHTIDSYSITRDEPKYANLYQSVINGQPKEVTSSSLVSNWSYEDLNGNVITNTCYYENGFAYFTGLGGGGLCDVDMWMDAGDVLFLSFDFTTYEVLGDSVDIEIDDTYTIYMGGFDAISQGVIHRSYYYVAEDDFEAHYIDIYSEEWDEFGFKNVMFINVTSIFGRGNEPTKEVFESYLTKDYYEFGNNSIQVGYQSVTYDDTDIGSQFVYALYKPIDKYFNLSQVGVFGQLYDFLQVNMFNGNAPISIFIVYHVILYEFIMDLIFLIYCVFMFIIDFAEKMLDSFFDMSFGGW